VDRGVKGAPKYTIALNDLENARVAARPKAASKKAAKK